MCRFPNCRFMFDSYCNVVHDCLLIVHQTPQSTICCDDSEDIKWLFLELQLTQVHLILVDFKIKHLHSVSEYCISLHCKGFL